MANGHTISEIFNDGKGKWTVLTMLLMTLAGGLSWWFTNEARMEIEHLRTYVDGRVSSALVSRDAVLDQRMDYINERLSKLENIVESQNRAIWAEMAKRVDRETLEDRRRDYERRIADLERRMDNLQNYFYRGGQTLP